MKHHYLMLLGRSLLAGCTAVYESDEASSAEQRDKQDTSNQLDTATISTFDLRKCAKRSGVEVLTHEVTRSYEILRRMNVCVFVVKSISEEEAELRAFYQLVAEAGALGADAIMEVKRSSVTNGDAETNAAIAGGGVNRGTYRFTCAELYDSTVNNYFRGQGTLSNRQFDTAFDRRGRSQHLIRFTANAIEYDDDTF